MAEEAEKNAGGDEAAAAAAAGTADKGAADQGVADKGAADASKDKDQGAAAKGADTGKDKTTDKAAEKGADTTKAADKALDAGKDEEEKPGAEWRQKWSGGDEKTLKRLERYPDEGAFVKAHMALLDKQSKGELKAPLSKEATDEQKAEWRKANGIPETHDKYEVKLEDGLVIGEPDRPLVDNFLKLAHDNNAPPEQVNAYLNWYYRSAKLQEEAMAEADAKLLNERNVELKEEWGADFKPNLNIIRGMMDGLPEDARNELMAAKSFDGLTLLHRPSVMRALAQMAREINPVATVVSTDGSANSPQGIETEIAEIEKLMREDRAAYNRDEPKQERLRKLYAAREKLSSRAA